MELARRTDSKWTRVRCRTWEQPGNPEAHGHTFKAMPCGGAMCFLPSVFHCSVPG